MADDLYQLQMDYLRQAAKARGIDPDIAVRAMKGEGLAPGVWQSRVQQPYGQERSYGAMQLHVAPEGRRPGLGNEFVAKTGLDPSDPKNYKEMIDFGLDNVVTGGWSPWFGAKAQGITGMMGVGDNAKVIPASYTSSPAPKPVQSAHPDWNRSAPAAQTPEIGIQPAPPGATPVNPMTARALALQKFVREGGTGGLRPGHSGVGPKSIEQALQMKRMKDSVTAGLDTAKEKLYGIGKTLTDALWGGVGNDQLQEQATSPVTPAMPAGTKPNLLNILGKK